MSDKEQNTPEERKPYLKVAPVPRIVRFAGGLIKLLSLVIIGIAIFSIFIFLRGEISGCCSSLVLLGIGMYIYHCGRRMQNGISDFIYGFSAIGLTLIIVSIIIYYRGSRPLGEAIFMGITIIYFGFPVTVALLNWRHLR